MENYWDNIKYNLKLGRYSRRNRMRTFRQEVKNELAIYNSEMENETKELKDISEPLDIQKFKQEEPKKEISLEEYEKEWFRYQKILKDKESFSYFIWSIVYLILLVIGGRFIPEGGFLPILFISLFFYYTILSGILKSKREKKYDTYMCRHNISGGYSRSKCDICNNERLKRGRDEAGIDKKLGFKKFKYIKDSKSASPIEELFYIQLKNNTDEQDFILIEQQYKIENYRVDFAIPSKNIVIELDGHDYHKSKIQRTNDAKRERFLQQKGWKVIRYTGSEIRININKCIDDFFILTDIKRKNIL